MKPQNGPFHPLRIATVPCDPETVRAHLEGFIRSFIRHEARPRAEHIIFRLSPKRPDCLRKLGRLIDSRFAVPPETAIASASAPETGVFFAGGDRA